MTTTTTTTKDSLDGVPLPSLSDEAAVEIYLFIEHAFMLFESRYGSQIRRHFHDRHQYSLFDPDFSSPQDEPPF